MHHSLQGTKQVRHEHAKKASRGTQTANCEKIIVYTSCDFMRDSFRLKKPWASVRSRFGINAHFLIERVWNAYREWRLTSFMLFIRCSAKIVSKSIRS